jgi:hypothetical protein
VTDSHHPREDRGADPAPLARAAVVTSVLGVVLGLLFVPQILGMALGLLSLARRERAGRRLALLAIGLSLLLTVGWGIALGRLLKWWAATQLGG